MNKTHYGTCTIMAVFYHVKLNTMKWSHSVSINPNLNPEVARRASASESLRVDCGRTGGHSFCQTERDWWSGLERWPGVFSYSNCRDRDSWTLWTLDFVCACVHICAALCTHSSISRCIVLFWKHPNIWGWRKLYLSLGFLLKHLFLWLFSVVTVWYILFWLVLEKNKH